MLGRHNEMRWEWATKGARDASASRASTWKICFFFVFFFVSFLFYCTNYSLQIDFECPIPPIMRWHHNVPRRRRRRTATSTRSKLPSNRRRQGRRGGGRRRRRGGQGLETQLRLELRYVFFMFFFIFYWWLYVDYTYINDDGPAWGKFLTCLITFFLSLTFVFQHLAMLMNTTGHWQFDEPPPYAKWAPSDAEMSLGPQVSFLYPFLLLTFVFQVLIMLMNTTVPHHAQNRPKQLFGVACSGPQGPAWGKFFIHFIVGPV